MKYADKINRLAWTLEFGAAYMHFTGCKPHEAFALGERMARKVKDHKPSAVPAAREHALKSRGVAVLPYRRAA